jgi:hypothetical protein
LPEYIAEDPVHVVVASEKPAIYDTRGNMVMPKQRRLWAKFQRGIAPGYAQQVALETFDFRKIHQGIERERWFGYYNSEFAQLQNNWTDEEHDRIVAKLDEQGYLRVEPKRLPAPWPAYDKLVPQGRRTVELVAEKIAATVAENGYDPAQVAAYERQNANRPEVLAALEAGVPDEEPEPLVVA